MKLPRKIPGYVTVRIEGFGIERFINICKNHNIPLYKLRFSENTSTVTLKSSNFRKICSFRKNANVKLRIISKTGMPFFLFFYRKRWLFVVGIFLCIGIHGFLSNFLWEIDVEGNSFYSDKTIKEYISSNNIVYGTPTRNISCNEIETLIRENFEKVTWVSATLKGARLTINLKENPDASSIVNNTSPWDIVAKKDGTIESIITRKGTPIVKAGDEVKKGDVLVMSRVDYTNESGEIFGTEYVSADSDIVIKTVNNFETCILRNYDKKQYTGNNKTFTSIKAGTYCISFPKMKCNFELFDTVTEYVPLDKSDRILPVTYIYTTYKEYELVPSEYTDEELTERLQEEFNNNIHKLEENGIQIIDNSVKIDLNADKGSLTGTITLLEKATGTKEPVINNEQPEGTASE